LQYGADIQWLSAFPEEAEVLYPPLTYLQPTGWTEELPNPNGKPYKVVSTHFESIVVHPPRAPCWRSNSTTTGR
tara:strand:+ start:358 stop:579 length:222 start_codon:yes stop_codon:yes gene_type:complete